MSGEAAKHPVLFKDSGDFDTFLAEIEKGATLTNASLAVGYRWISVRRMIEQSDDLQRRFAQAWENRLQQQADKVDNRVEELVLKDNPAPATVALWAKRHNHAYREKLEVTGEGGGPIRVRSQESPFSSLTAADLEALVRAARTKQIADAEVVIDADADEG